MFLGPNEILATPYGSVWLDGQQTLMQESTLTVLVLYPEADFDFDDEFRELSDHVATELEFLYLLIHRENRACAEGDAAAFATMHDLKRRF